MNSKTVLNKILSLLSKEEVVLTYAKLADGNSRAKRSNQALSGCTPGN